jgi:hypothetical protein
MPGKRVPAGLKALNEPTFGVTRVVEFGGESTVGGDGVDFTDVLDLLDADGVAE